MYKKVLLFFYLYVYMEKKIYKINYFIGGKSIEKPTCANKIVKPWRFYTANWIIDNYINCDQENLLKEMKKQLELLKNDKGNFVYPTAKDAVSKISIYTYNYEPKLDQVTLIKRLLIAGYTIEKDILSDKEANWTQPEPVVRALFDNFGKDISKVIENLKHLAGDGDVYTRALKELYNISDPKPDLKKLKELKYDMELIVKLDPKYKNIDLWLTTEHNFSKNDIYRHFGISKLLKNGKITLLDLKELNYSLESIMNYNKETVNGATFKVLYDLGYTNEDIINYIVTNKNDLDPEEDHIYYLALFILENDNATLLQFKDKIIEMKKLLNNLQEYPKLGLSKLLPTGIKKAMKKSERNRRKFEKKAEFKKKVVDKLVDSGVFPESQRNNYIFL